MSRRRAQKQQEKEEFLDQNPQLNKFETRFEVVEVVEVVELTKVTKGGEGDSPVQLLVQSPPMDNYDMPTRYEALVTHDGKVAPSITDGELAFPGLTVSEGVFSPFGNLFGADIENGKGMPASLSLSENGFGVVSEDDLFDSPAPNGLMMEKGGMPPQGNSHLFALDGDEILVFGPDLFGQPSPGNQLAGLRDFDIRDSDFEFGNTEFGIDYTVLSGRGTVEIDLFSFGDDPDSDPIAEGSSSFLRNAQDGSLEVEADGTYDFAVISVTGSLEITVAGIDVTSNVDFMSST